MSTDEKKTTKARTTRVSILRVGILVVVTAAVIGFGLMVFRPVVAPAASIVRTACCPSAVRPSWATGSVSHTARCRSCAAMLCCKDAIA